jgi:SAM-dependent methyltransferase
MKQEFAEQYAGLEDTHWWFRARTRVLQSVVSSIAWPPRPAIVEIGVGSGKNLYTLYPKDARLTGIEPEEHNAAKARARGPVPVYVAIAEDLPPQIGDASLDALTMFDVLEHTADDALVLQRVRKKLKPGGRLILTVPAFMFLWGQQDDVAHHYRRYTASQLRGRVEAAGFAVRRVTYLNTLLFPPIALVRLLARLRPKKSEPSPSADFAYSLGPLDGLLYGLFACEAFLLRWMNLPFGISVLLVAERRP